MAQLSEKEFNSTRRKIPFLANHLSPACPYSGSGSLALFDTSMDDIYHRIHREVRTHEVVWERTSGLGSVPMSNASMNDSYGEVPTLEVVWERAFDDSGKEFTDIIYEKAVGEGVAKITINRPQRRNAFRLQTIKELMRAFNYARDDSAVGVIILTGKGAKAFCGGADDADIRRRDVLNLQEQIRQLPKPVIAMIAGNAIGGGHILHMVCDLTIAAENAGFGQKGPKVVSFDAADGSSLMSRLIGPKKVYEMWLLNRFYTASEAEKMGLVNTVVPLENLEKETVKWCREILRNGPTAIRELRSALNTVDDVHAGLQELGGNVTPLFYGNEEGNEDPMARGLDTQRQRALQQAQARCDSSGSQQAGPSRDQSVERHVQAGERPTQRTNQQVALPAPPSNFGGRGFSDARGASSSRHPVPPVPSLDHNSRRRGREEGELWDEDEVPPLRRRHAREPAGAETGLSEELKAQLEQLVKDLKVELAERYSLISEALREITHPAEQAEDEAQGAKATRDSVLLELEEANKKVQDLEFKISQLGNLMEGAQRSVENLRKIYPIFLSKARAQGVEWFLRSDAFPDAVAAATMNNTIDIYNEVRGKVLQLCPDFPITELTFIEGEPIDSAGVSQLPAFDTTVHVKWDLNDENCPMFPPRVCEEGEEYDRAKGFEDWDAGMLDSGMIGPPSGA